MKKSIILVTATSLMLLSCAETEKLNQDIKDNSKAPLAFTAYSNVITRATDAANSAKLEDFYNQFAVYGWKTVGSEEPQEVFKNHPNQYFSSDDITGNVPYLNKTTKPADEWGTTLSAGWYYEDIRYWDKLATYQFFAIAPYDNSQTPYYTIAAGANNFSLYKNEDGKRYDISTEANLMAAKPLKNLVYVDFTKDFMIAEKKSTESIAQTITASNDDVNLVFHHILSKLNVMIKKDTDFKGKQNLVVTDLKIVKLKKEGSFVYTTNMTTNGWTTTGSYNIELTNKNYSLNSTTPDENYDECYWIENLIFPQSITCKKNYESNAIVSQPDNTNLESYLYIAYKIGDEVFKAYYDLANIFGVGTVNDTYTFAQGSQYRVTITIGPKPIHFTVELINWTEDTTRESNDDIQIDHGVDAN